MGIKAGDPARSGVHLPRGQAAVSYHHPPCADDLGIIRTGGIWGSMLRI